MGLAAFVLFVFGLYLFLTKRFGREGDVDEETRSFGSRLGRSVHGAGSIGLAGLTGQGPLEPAPPIRESVGPEETHTLVLDERGRPVRPEEMLGPSDLGPYRDPSAPEAAMAAPKKAGKRKTRKET